jgi:thiol-disulfide isomerase/thioredoxin
MQNRLLIAFVVLGITMFSHTTTHAQKSLRLGDNVTNIALNLRLNDSKSGNTFNASNNNLTIIDFFGTWCTPCIRALPHLTSIREKYKNVSVLLVSNEPEAKLSKFIAARKNFSFPVVVDTKNEWNNLFQPPALPYTVIVNKAGKIVSITEAEDIKDSDIEKWLRDSASGSTGAVKAISSSPATNMIRKSENKTVQLSQDLIYEAKTGETAAGLVKSLQALEYSTLATSLKTDDEKKAFWINVYNAYTQLMLKADPSKYKNRNTFFKSKTIRVAGKQFSLDDVEHGILRRSKIKWSLGYLNKLFPSGTEKELRVDEVDYRIHFALNCGAKSCPPIAFYDPQTLEQQLDIATKAYLSGEAEYDSTTNKVRVPKLMSWFRADFGGKKGMLKILKEHNIIPSHANPKIRFKPYDWTLTLNNYNTGNL